MAKRRTIPQNHPYSSFDVIGEAAEVHLRLVGETLEDEPTYRDAKLMSAPAGKPGVKSAVFFVPSLGHSVRDISEAQYVAWTRYSS